MCFYLLIAVLLFGVSSCNVKQTLYDVDYTGVPLMWTPLEPSQSVLIRGVLIFRGCFIYCGTSLLQPRMGQTFQAVI